MKRGLSLLQQSARFAEVCGIKVNGNNKWITLIQNASKTKALA
jgi:hypothetical protein